MTKKLIEIFILLYVFFEYCFQFCVKMLVYYEWREEMKRSIEESMSVFHLYNAFFNLSVVLVNAVARTALGELRTMAILSGISIGATVALYVDLGLSKDNNWRIVLLLILAMTTGGNFKCVKYICYSQYSLPSETHQYKRMLFAVVVVRCLGEIYGSFMISIFSDVADPKSKIRKEILIIVHKIIGAICILIGYKLYKTKKNSRNVVYHFLKFSFNKLKIQIKRIIHSEVKRNDENYEKRYDNEHKVEAVYLLLPLYIPIIIILAFKDQKFTVFLHQSETISKTNDDNYLMILMFCPFFTLLNILVFHFIVIPLGLKYQKNLSSSQYRTYFALSSLAMSFAASVVVEIRLESSTKNEYNILIPQIYLMSVTDALVLAPRFVYKDNKVPKKWIELTITLWFLSAFVGNILIVFFMRYEFYSRQLDYLMGAFLAITSSIFAIVGLSELIPDNENKRKSIKIQFAQVGN